MEKRDQGDPAGLDDASGNGTPNGASANELLILALCWRFECAACFRFGVGARSRPLGTRSSRDRA